MSDKIIGKNEMYEFLSLTKNIIDAEGFTNFSKYNFLHSYPDDFILSNIQLIRLNSLILDISTFLVSDVRSIYMIGEEKRKQLLGIVNILSSIREDNVKLVEDCKFKMKDISNGESKC